MSTRTRIGPKAVISNGDMTGDLTSEVTILQSASIISYEYVITGTPVGTIVIEGSNDYSVDPTGTVQNAGTWESLPLNVNGTSSSSIAVNGAGGGFADLSLNGMFAVRTRYVAGSSTGVLNVTANGKVS